MPNFGDSQARNLKGIRMLELLSVGMTPFSILYFMIQRGIRRPLVNRNMLLVLCHHCHLPKSLKRIFKLPNTTGTQPSHLPSWNDTINYNPKKDWKLLRQHRLAEALSVNQASWTSYQTLIPITSTSIAPNSWYYMVLFLLLRSLFIAKSFLGARPLGMGLGYKLSWASRQRDWCLHSSSGCFQWLFEVPGMQR